MELAKEYYTFTTLVSRTNIQSLAWIIAIRRHSRRNYWASVVRYAIFAKSF